MLIHLQERMRFTSPIVIVDEEIELVRTMAEHLRREYFPVPVVGHSTSRQAAALIARERPALLICNLQMPQVGGVDLITMARKRWGNLPTVVLINMGLNWSGYAKVDGAPIYVEKPVDMDGLCELISELPGSPPRSTRAPLPDTVLIDAALLAGEPSAAAPDAAADAEDWQESVQEMQAFNSGNTAQAQLAAFKRFEDQSWHSETPLPPPSRKGLEEAEDHRAFSDFLEVLDAEIELIEYQDEQRSTVNDRSDHLGDIEMALTASNVKENLTKLEGIEGFIGAALADSDSGMCVGFVGGGGVINLEIAAAANTEVVRSKRKAMKALNLRDDIEDILITLGKQYHLVRPVRSRPNLFFYVVLDRQRANLAMARFTLADTERELPM